MISVLIPVYNYNIIPLVEAIHEQFMASSTIFEILCIDDASDKNFSKENTIVGKLNFVSYIISDENEGRIKTRQLLAGKAKYNWLLFLDADVLPRNKKFISNYLNILQQNYEVIFGGFTYQLNPPENEFMLRWKYGRSQEEVSAQDRNKKPYKAVASANFLIRAEVFKNILSNITKKGYGLDNYIGALLKEEKVQVLHINNEVYHLGIEKSKDYLAKIEQAINNLLELVKDKNKIEHDNSLLNLFMIFKRLKLNYIFAFIYRAFKEIMKNNLLSSNPSIKLLQLYKVSYMCNIDLKKK